MIVRNDVNDYKRSKRKKRTERKPDDWDLAFGVHRVYVLDDGEYFDHGKHGWHGPAVVHCAEHPTHYQCDEWHVNDPRIWAWVRRCIAEGHLTADTITPGLNHERDVIVS